MLTVLAMASATAFVLVYVAAARFGPGVTYDSTMYMSAAASLAAGHGLTRLDGGPLTSWPPLYSWLMGAGAILQFDPMPTGLLVNAISYAAAVFLAGALVWSATRAWLPLLVLCAGALCSPALIHCGATIWSESLFIALLMAVLAWGVALEETPTGVRIVLGSLLVGAATCARAIGVFLLVPAIIAILTVRSLTWVRRVTMSLTLAVVSLIPIYAWSMWVQQRTGSMLGRRVPSTRPLGENVRRATTEVGNWFSRFTTAQPTWPVVAGAVVLAALVLVGLVAVAARRAPRAAQRTVLLACVTGLAYLAAIVAMATTIEIDAITMRLVVPAFLPMAVALTASISLLQQGPDAGGKRRLPVLAQALILALVWILPAYGKTKEFLFRARVDGVEGFGTKLWRETNIMPVIRNHDPASIELTNAPDAIYAVTGRKAQFVPGPGNMDRMKNMVAEAVRQGHPVYATWFTNFTRTYVPTEAEVGREFVLTEDYRDKDGKIDRVFPKEPQR